MDSLNILKKELSYFKIRLIDNVKCQVFKQTGELKVQSIGRTIGQIKNKIKEHKKILESLWEDVVTLLKEEKQDDYIFDDKMVSLFIFSLKDMAKFLLCFDRSEFLTVIDDALKKDILDFNYYQINTLPDYKISIDWIYRLISRLIYISNLLEAGIKVKSSFSFITVKTARGISGPWANLDLPMEERVFEFGDILQEREKDKKKQRRYTKGLENYNNGGAVAEGHYWREIRNEPFLWADRATESPYPGRHILTRW